MITETNERQGKLYKTIKLRHMYKTDALKSYKKFQHNLDIITAHDLRFTRVLPCSILYTLNTKTITKYKKPHIHVTKATSTSPKD